MNQSQLCVSAFLNLPQKPFQNDIAQIVHSSPGRMCEDHLNKFLIITTELYIIMPDALRLEIQLKVNIHKLVPFKYVNTLEQKGVHL